MAKCVSYVNFSGQILLKDVISFKPTRLKYSMSYLSLHPRSMVANDTDF